MIANKINFFNFTIIDSFNQRPQFPLQHGMRGRFFCLLYKLNALKKVLQK